MGVDRSARPRSDPLTACVARFARSGVPLPNTGPVASRCRTGRRSRRLSHGRNHGGSEPGESGEVARILALAKEAKQLVAKQSLTYRPVLSLLAGLAIGTYSYVFEAADLATLASGLQIFWADPAWPSLNARLFGADGLGMVVSFS